DARAPAPRGDRVARRRRPLRREPPDAVRLGRARARRRRLRRTDARRVDLVEGVGAADPDARAGGGRPAGDRRAGAGERRLPQEPAEGAAPWVEDRLTCSATAARSIIARTAAMRPSR